MQIYLKDQDLYCFNWQKISKTGYMAENFLTNQKYQKNNKSNIEYKSNILANN